MINYEKLPAFARGPMKMWVEFGLHPGGYCMAIIQNDLRGAVANATSEGLASLVTIMRWLMNEAPAECWGSTKAAVDWKTIRTGLIGK